jgi:4-hydroxythreonine-4-phosphate dehydrogenase
MATAPIAVTMGDPNGIGSEITIKTWQARSKATPAFFLIDNPSRIEQLLGHFGLAGEVTAIKAPGEAVGRFTDTLPVLPIEVDERTSFGAADTAHSASILESLNIATQLCLNGEASALLTNPINKEMLHKVGFSFPGHTEFLEAACAAPNLMPSRAIMMLASRFLRVVPVTIHLPLSEVASTLSSKAIREVGLTVDTALRVDFDVVNPRIAVAALNPHAGEGGSFGTEETDIIAPAISELQSVGVNATGPYPADSLFHEDRRRDFDAVICMYHDQALIPLKTLSFFDGANITLGLPIVRTSPDHGVAYDIAGTYAADNRSFAAALEAAEKISANRKLNRP